MINTIEITPETEPDQLRKLLRKKLMTGGAVLRIAAGLTETEKQAIFSRFVESTTPGVVRHSASALVLKELASEQQLDPSIREKLIELQNPEIDLTLLRRADLPDELRVLLTDRRKSIRGSGSSPWAGGACGRIGETNGQ